ncbi:DnaD domain-containing protein [Aciduricibacillus chroicocephali]|uniref:DnaD domain-containing protein n=2 Tax=Aciduricibacillus chroicocephali TaxID=3054939 RepID=A0ABY9KZ66_9BACI|nr:DnaD domain-containing protein [Bacillaceae bacterium 44XB]
MESLLLNQINVPEKLLECYTSLGMDEVDLAIILQIQKSLRHENLFPTPDELSTKLTISGTECGMALRKLIQKGLLAMSQQQNESGQITEVYSLEPLWEKLISNPKKVEEEESVDGAIFLLFEQEFGRPLSPFEIDMMNSWLDEDKIDPALIKAGLRESVLMSKLSFKYIDRILREWKQKGVHTVDQARQASKSFRSRQNSPTVSKPKRDTSFYYNWLEEED